MTVRYVAVLQTHFSITLWCKILGNWTSQHFVRRTLSFWRHSRCLCLISGSSSFCPPLLASVWNYQLCQTLKSKQFHPFCVNFKQILWQYYANFMSKCHCEICTFFNMGLTPPPFKKCFKKIARLVRWGIPKKEKAKILFVSRVSKNSKVSQLVIVD